MTSDPVSGADLVTRQPAQIDVSLSSTGNEGGEGGLAPQGPLDPTIPALDNVVAKNAALLTDETLDASDAATAQIGSFESFAEFAEQVAGRYEFLEPQPEAVDLTQSADAATIETITPAPAITAPLVLGGEATEQLGDLPVLTVPITDAVLTPPPGLLEAIRLPAEIAATPASNALAFAQGVSLGEPAAATPATATTTAFAGTTAAATASASPAPTETSLLATTPAQEAGAKLAAVKAAREARVADRVERLADVQAAASQSGSANTGLGTATGSDFARALPTQVSAAAQAIASPNTGIPLDADLAVLRDARGIADAASQTASAQSLAQSANPTDAARAVRQVIEELMGNAPRTPDNSAAISAQTGTASLPGTDVGSALSGSATTGSRGPLFVPPSQQMLFQINRAVMNGDQRFTVRMDPPELGRVFVRLDFQAEGTVRAMIGAERQETLDLLQRDSRLLERAFQDAGVKTDGQSLNFTLGGGEADNDGRFARANSNGASFEDILNGDVPEEESVALDDDIPTIDLDALIGRDLRGGLDIRI